MSFSAEEVLTVDQNTSGTIKLAYVLWSKFQKSKYSKQ